MLKIKAFAFNPFQENTYVLHDETKECVIIDPGCFDTSEKLELTDFIASNGLRPVKLLNTHCHIDHVLGNAYCKRNFGIELSAHKKDEPVLRAVKAYASNYGFAGYEESEIDHYIDEGDVVQFGSTNLEVLFVPGHAPGHVAFYHADTKQLMGGDVLFRQSIGRIDLPGGDHSTLIKSIHEKLFTLSDDVEVFPGHGETTTIGYEKVYNPFCGLKR
jgi:hydroxyacylglutathione hydrolase